MAGATEALSQGLQRRCPLSHYVEESSVGTRVRNEKEVWGAVTEAAAAAGKPALPVKPFIPV